MQGTHRGPPEAVNTANMPCLVSSGPLQSPTNNTTYQYRRSLSRAPCLDYVHVSSDATIGHITAYNQHPPPTFATQHDTFPFPFPSMAPPKCAKISRRIVPTTRVPPLARASSKPPPCCRFHARRDNHMQPAPASPRTNRLANPQGSAKQGNMQKTCSALLSAPFMQIAP